MIIFRTQYHEIGWLSIRATSDILCHNIDTIVLGSNDININPLKYKTYYWHIDYCNITARNIHKSLGSRGGETIPKGLEQIIGQHSIHGTENSKSLWEDNTNEIRKRKVLRLSNSSHRGGHSSQSWRPSPSRSSPAYRIKRL